MSGLSNDVEVAVVVPTHNSQPWLEECLTSALQSTISSAPREIVVVDDGSTDGTLALADRVLGSSNHRFAILRTRGKEGPSRARNIGWRATSAPWIQFLDSDDVLGPGKIDLQFAAAKGLSRDTAVVYSDWGRMHKVGCDWKASEDVRRPRIGADTIADLLTSDNFMQVGSQLYSRRWLERVNGWDERHWLIEDVDLALRLAMVGGTFELVAAEEPVFWQRMRENSLSQQGRLAFQDGCLRNARMAAEYWKTHDGLNEIRKTRLADVFLMASRVVRDEDPGRADELLHEVQRLAPGCLPSGTALLRVLARGVGLSRAERLMRRARKLKSRLRNTLKTMRHAE